MISQRGLMDKMSLWPCVSVPRGVYPLFISGLHCLGSALPAVGEALGESPGFQGHQDQSLWLLPPYAKEGGGPVHLS